MNSNKPRRAHLAWRITRIIFRTVLFIILFFAIIALLILTPPVQNFIRKKAQTFLANKLGTRVEIGKIYIGFPKKVVIENVYLEDKQKDTLLAGGKLKVDISMLKLLSNEIEINDVELSNITAKIKRVLPDTVYNFQFVVDAFAPKTPAPDKPQDTAAMKMDIKEVSLDKIRLVYNDAVTGSDMTVWLEHFDTEIDAFDPATMKFDVPVTRMNGLVANIYQRKPLVQPESAAADSAEAKAATPMDISFGRLELSDIHLDYGNDVSAFYTKLDLGEFELRSENIDMKNQRIDLSNVRLDKTFAMIRMGKKAAAEEVVKQVEQEVKSEAATGWRIYVDAIRLNNNHIQFINENEPRLSRGMDYAHIDARELTLHADNFVFANDSIAASITKGSMREQSGFVLNTLQTDFLYSGTQAYLNNLLIETPGTTLRRSLAIRYPSIASLQKNIGAMQLDLDLHESKIQVKDLLVFAPQLASQAALSNPSATLYLDADVNGSVANMNINELRFSGLRDTRANLRGRISGLPDANKLNGNIVITTFRTTKADIQTLAPRGSLPTNITLPQFINMNGSVAGSMQSARANLNINTNLGRASVDGTIRNATNPQTAQYDARLFLDRLDLGTIMQNDSLFGPVTATFAAAGRGFDMKTADATVKGMIESAVLNRYNYRNVQLDASIARQQATTSLNIEDPNIDLTLTGSANLALQFPSIALNAVIDSIKPNELNFTADTLSYHGNINADFASTDPANPEGRLLVTESVLRTATQRYALDTISVDAGRSDTGQYIRMASDAVSMALTGQYHLAQLGTVFQHALQPYYAMGAPVNADSLKPYNFYLTGQVVNGPMLKLFMPTLERLEPISLNAHFVQNDGWNANVAMPLFIMGTNRVENFKLTAATNESALVVDADLGELNVGGMHVYATSIDATLANNAINFLMNVRDKENKPKYRFGGLFRQPETGVYALSLNPDSVLLDYDKWNIPADNMVSLNKGDIHVANLILAKGNQQLGINSTAAAPNAPLNVTFSNFRIGTITGFIKQDTLLADGTVNGVVLLKDLPTQPTFTSDLTITDLTFKKDTVGNIALKVDNTRENIFHANATITGRGNQVVLNGDYFVKPANQSVFDLNVDVQRLEMKSLQALSMGSIANASGFINGGFDIKGTVETPDVNGSLNFNQTVFTPVMLGSSFRIDQEKIQINPQGIRFETFTIRDSANNALVLDGIAATTNFINYNLDLNLTADNFQALNSTKRAGQLFYGRLFFNTNLHIRGTEKKPVIDGSLKINEKTDLTVLLPQQNPAVEDREGIVRFVDMDSVRMDSTILLASYDSINKSEVTGMEVSANIEIDKNAVFSLVIDEANGDFVKMKGAAVLTGGIDASGKVTLTGTYEIEEGSYELSFNMLRRRFDIRKGSKITWLGEPTRADVDVTAIYVSRTAPLSLVENQIDVPNLNIYKQKLPFEVNLNVKGEIMKPEISFDIELPEEKNFNVDATVIENIDARLTQLRSEPSELNKQVFALLLLNRFVTENPFASSSEGGGFNAGAVARQSVSKILTEQLNNLADDLIQGVDINFDVASTEDYTTGSMQNRTDLNVSLSKQLLNDRLRVTVGSNFELEGPQNSNQQSSNIAGNVALDYMLSKDGRYMLRAYRRNEYEGEVEGYIIETGLNFIITLDYNRFRDIFRKKKQQTTNTGDRQPKPAASDSGKAEGTQPEGTLNK
jgi:translocation and assembly module TamB